jgi:large subunit ribosomal protein L23
MSLVVTPKISEKAIYLAERGRYVFEVPMNANKIEVAKAIEATFKVTVVDVNIVITKGKAKKFRQIKGTQKDVKKAIIKLKAGQSIGLFEGAN